MGWIAWIGGGFLLFLALRMGAVSSEYERAGKKPDMYFADFLGFAFVVVGALMWRAA